MAKKIGRKSKYFTHVEPKLDLIKSWRQAGESEIMIADKLNIAYSTFKKYKNENKAFLAVLNASKEKLVNNLKQSLFKEALGFTHEETEQLIEEIPVKNPNYDKTDQDSEYYIIKKKKKIRKITKFARGAPNLLIFALCNLCPEEFKRADKDAVKELKDELNNLVVNEEKTNKILEIMYSNAIKEGKNKDDS